MQATGERKPAKRTARTGETVSVLFINRDGADHRHDLDLDCVMLPGVEMVAPAGRHRKAGVVEGDRQPITATLNLGRHFTVKVPNPPACNALLR